MGGRTRAKPGTASGRARGRRGSPKRGLPTRWLQNRWLLACLGLGIALVALYGLLSTGADRAEPEIDAASRAELLQVLKDEGAAPESSR